MLDKGFLHVSQFITGESLVRLTKVLNTFHTAYLERSAEHLDNGGLNSAYITNPQYMDMGDRVELFKLIAGQEIVSLLGQIQIREPRFLNTQLFFNPKNLQQKNYWHRDIQYTDNTEDQQRAIIEGAGTQVVHFRIPLKDEPGLELVPGTHARWDTDQEYATRFGKGDAKVYDPIKGAQLVPLKAGDLLIFDANMIHRGLYGDDRLSFDILYCENDPDILKYRSVSSLPNQNDLNRLSKENGICTNLF